MPKITIPSRVVKQQTSAMVQRAIEAFGRVRSQAALLDRIYRLLYEYFTRLGQPMMRVREALPGGPPWADDYNDSIRELHDDLVVLTGESNLHKSAIVADYNFAKTEGVLLASKLAGLADKLRDVQLYHGAKTLSLFARDSFNDMSKVDMRKVVGVPADIDTTYGFVTLRRSGSRERQEGAAIEIVPGTPIEGTYGLLGSESNGFPGNLHELTVDPASYQGPVEAPSEKYKFVGEDNSHGDWTAVADGQPDTWFEYELVNLEQQYKDEAKGYGFAFDVPPDGEIRWDRDPEGGKLKLHLQVTLKEPALINWIGIRLYVPPNDGAQAAHVDDIRVSRDGVEIPVSIIQESDMFASSSGELVYSFPPRTVLVAHFYFSQDTHFPIAVGHIYYKRVTVVRRQAHYVFGLIHGASRTETTVTRVDGPNLPITALGVTTNNPTGDLGGVLAGMGALVYAVGYVGQALAIAGLAALGPIGMGIAVAGLVLGGLYNESAEVVRDDVESGIEMFPGWRYAIGIADITLNTYTFAERSEFVSVPYASPMPVRSLMLRTKEFIPASFPSDQRWIRYYVSLDDGINWFEIAPEGVVIEGVPQVYRINARELPATRDPRVGYLETDVDVHAVRLKVVLARPSGEEYSTPILYDYVLVIGTDSIDA